MDISLGSNYSARLAHCRTAANLNSLGGLIEEQRPYLLSLAASLLRAGELAQGGPDDLVQQVYAKALQAFDQFSGETEAAIQHWLAAILKNELSNWRRANATKKRGGQPAVNTAWSLLEQVEDEAPSPSSHARRDEQQQALRSAIDKLPLRVRAAARLRFLEEQNYEAVGAALGITADAARKLCKQAFVRLRMQLARDAIN